MSGDFSKDGLLAQPPQLGRLRSCLHCRKLFALKFVSKQHTDNQGEITRYRCKKCGAECEFAQFHPPDAI